MHGGSGGGSSAIVGLILLITQENLILLVVAGGGRGRRRSPGYRRCSIHLIMRGYLMGELRFPLHGDGEDSIHPLRYSGNGWSVDGNFLRLP